MYLFYNSCLILFFILTAPYYLFHILLREHYRAGLRQRLGFVAMRPGNDGAAVRVWFHGVSVGEIQVLLDLGEKLAAESPHVRPVYSTTTLTAQRLAAGRLAAGRDLIYFPLDIPFAVRRALDRVNPALVVLAETELWPNFLRECHRRNIPVLLVNGRISDRSFGRYRVMRGFTRIFLPWVEAFMMQSQTYAERIISLGAPAARVRVTGNMKADSVAAPRAASGDLEEIFRRLRSSPAAKILVAGSTHPGEEAILAGYFRAWKAQFPQLVLVLAPRHVIRVETICKELDALGCKVVRRSKEVGAALEGAEILILDTLGELASAYRWADLVFIGKSLNAKGGQNPMEAASLAKPVIFGPHMENFPVESAELLQAGGAVRVPDAAGLRDAVPALLRDTAAMEEKGRCARRAVENLRGATGKNLNILKDRIALLPVIASASTDHRRS